MLMGLSCMGSGFVLLLLFLENIPVYGIAAILCLIGLGMVSREIGQESPLQAYKLVFGINIFICIGVIILMVAINRRPFKSA